MKGRGIRTGVIALACIILSATAAAAAERTVRLKVPEMVCVSRGAAAIAAATSVAGVKSADDDLENTTLVVIFDDDTASVEQIKKTLAREHYPVEGEPVFVGPR